MEWMDLNDICEIMYTSKKSYVYSNYRREDWDDIMEKFYHIFPYALRKISIYKKYSLFETKEHNIIDRMIEILMAEANILFIISSTIYTEFDSIKSFQEYLDRNKKYVSMDYIDSMSYFIEDIKSLSRISLLARIYQKKID